MVEALLLLVVLTLGSSIAPLGSGQQGLTEVRFKAMPNQREAEQQDKAPDIKKAERPVAKLAQPEPAPVPVVQPQQPAPAPLIRLSSKEMASTDIAALPRQPGPPAATRPAMGPPAPGGSSGDSALVGSAPNGEPLYAAAWYREPYPDELSGYLSTATGPGWGLIACRTASDYRVEDCVKLDEYPTGSNIARAVLAAAWQFKVRPPRVGGQSKIGEWVRIRIDYGMRRKQG